MVNAVKAPWPAPPTHKPWYRRWRYAGIRLGRRAIGLDDTPYRVAMGTACGLFCSVLPTLGQTVVGVALARLLGGNIVICLVWSWFNNPFTLLPLVFGCYRTGAWLLGLPPVGWTEISADLTGSVTRLFTPLIVGSLVVGILLGAVGFAVMHPLVTRLQRRRAERIRAWAGR